MTSSPTLWLGFPRKRSGEGPYLSTTEPNCDQLPVPHVKTNTNRNLSWTTEWAPMLGNALWLSLGAPQSSSNSREDAAFRAEGRNCCFKELGSHNVLGFAFACFSKRTYMKICRAKTPGPKSQDCKLKGTSFFSYFSFILQRISAQVLCIWGQRVKHCFLPQTQESPARRS